MSRQIRVALVLTFLVWGRVTVWVPTYHLFQGKFAWALYPDENPIAGRWRRIEYRWVWDRFEPNQFDRGYFGKDYDIHWPLLLAQQSLALLLGGGVLTYLIRRHRERPAAAAG